MQLSTTLRSNRAGEIKTLADTSTPNGGTMEVYSGTDPGVGGSLAGNTKFVTLTGVTFTNNANGTLSVAATAANAIASGTPTFAVFKNSAGTDYMHMTSGVNTGEVSWSSSISSGGSCAISSGTLTEGNA